MKNKEALRRHLRKMRIQLSHIEQQQKSQQIISHILQSKIFNTANKVGYYHAVRGEANPANLNTNNPEHKLKKFYLPIISSKRQALEFAPVTPRTQYQNNQFNIPEPIHKLNELIDVDKLDLLILPLLGFDKNGNRLGMGGGYYDRCLSYKQKRPEKKPLLVGFSYAFQEIEAIKTESWDIGLDWIATENGLHSSK